MNREPNKKKKRERNAQLAGREENSKRATFCNALSTNFWTSSSLTSSLNPHQRHAYLTPSPPCTHTPTHIHTVYIKRTLKKYFFFGNRLANTLSCLLQATKALLGRPALSPQPSRPPLCSRTQRGRKSRSVFASHVGTRALYTLQWHCRYFVSLTNRSGADKGCEKF